LATPTLLAPLLVASASAPVVRVILVEDEPLYRDMLSRALAGRPAIDVVGTFGDAETALAQAAQLRPDVALLDIELPGALDGIELGLRLVGALPGLGIVLLSNHADPRFVSALPSSVATGWSYLLKKSVGDVETLHRAVDGAAAGSVTVDPAVVASLRPRTAGRIARLSPRQREMVELLAQGLTNSGIATRMVLSEKSVENAITRLYQDLDIDRDDSAVQPRVQAVLLYLRESRLAAD
jgi:DNA-binding NarL/FixJ family response regulator